MKPGIKRNRLDHKIYENIVLAYGRAETLSEKHLETLKIKYNEYEYIKLLTILNYNE